MRQNKKNRLPVKINTASMPDIIFMLLFFFMVTTTVQKPHANRTNLPRVENHRQFDDESSNVLNITLTQDKVDSPKLWINSQLVKWGNLEQQLLHRKKHLSKNGQHIEKTVLWIDGEMKLGSVNKVKNALRRAQISQIEYVHDLAQ